MAQLVLIDQGHLTSASYVLAVLGHLFRSVHSGGVFALSFFDIITGVIVGRLVVHVLNRLLLLILMEVGLLVVMNLRFVLVALIVSLIVLTIEEVADLLRRLVVREGALFIFVRLIIVVAFSQVG